MWLSSYVGVPRRVEYTFNNSDPSGGVSPPPCMLDWPVASPAQTYTIKHCPNMVSTTAID